MKGVIFTENNLIFDHLQNNGQPFRIGVLPDHSDEEGVWIPIKGGLVAKFACSLCDVEEKYATRYCPHCGARNKNPFEEREG